MTDTKPTLTYRLYQKVPNDNHRERVVVHEAGGVIIDPSGALLVYFETPVDHTWPDVVYAPGHWTRAVKNVEERV